MCQLVARNYIFSFHNIYFQTLLPSVMERYKGSVLGYSVSCRLNCLHEIQKNWQNIAEVASQYTNTYLCMYNWATTFNCLSLKE